MDLHFLNDLKKENKDKRREQNKRYRQKIQRITQFKKTALLPSRKFRKKTSKKNDELKLIQ